MAPSSDMKSFQDVLCESRNIIAIAGAGLSAASGIPTYRSGGGLWRKYNAVELATPKGFKKSPSLLWQFYHYRREILLKAKPNRAHRALAAFSQSSIRNKTAPGSSFKLITQNVDSLSPKTNQELTKVLPADQVEEIDVIEMHGRVFDVLCSGKDCKHIEFNTASPISEALVGTETLVEAGVLDPIIDLKDLPHCSKCGELARPGVVLFGEVPHRMKEINELVKTADLCLVVGTSSLVYPAAGYAAKVKKRGGRVAVFNIEQGEKDRNADFLFLGPCEDLLPEALGLSNHPFVVSPETK